MPMHVLFNIMHVGRKGAGGQSVGEDDEDEVESCRPAIRQNHAVPAAR